MVGNTKPLLFIDVDGVINVMHALFSENPLVTVEVIEDQHGPVAAIPEGTGNRLLELMEWFEPRWCTAWFSRASILTTHFNLSPWEICEWGDMKLPKIIEDAGDRPWAFIDDEIEFELNHFEGEIPPIHKAFIYGIDQRHGLTDFDVLCLKSWASRLPG